MRPAAAPAHRAVSPVAVLIIVSIANLAIQMDAIGMFAVYPALLNVFAGFSESSLSWVLNAYTIAVAAVLVPAGRLADRFGRRRLFLLGALLYGLGAGLCGVAPTPALLIAARLVQGLGAALVIPTSLALVMLAFPAERRAGAVNQWVAGGAIGGALAPILSGLLVVTIGWRWFFALGMLLGGLAFLLGSRLLPESEGDVVEPLPDGLGLGLLFAGLTLLALGVVRAEGLAVAGLGRPGTVAAALLLLAGFALRSLRVPNPAVDLALLRHPVRALASLGMLLFGVSFSAMFLAFNLFLTRQWHFNSLEAGLAITAGPAASMLTAQGARRLADRYGHRALMIPGALAYGLGGLLLAASVYGPRDPVGYWLAGQLIGGMGVGLSLSALSGLTVFALARERYAVGAGVSQATRQFGSVIGVALLVAAQQSLEPSLAYSGTFAAMTLCGAVLVLFGLVVRRRTGAGAT